MRWKFHLAWFHSTPLVIMGRQSARLRNRQRYLDRVNAEERAERGIPVFYLEQDKTTETAGKGKLTRAEVRDMKAANLGCFIDHGKAFRLYESAPAPPRAPAPSDSGSSDATISVNEMRANVGEPPPNTDVLARGTVTRAQQKIRAVGLYAAGTTDTKAPLARDHRRNHPKPVNRRRRPRSLDHARFFVGIRGRTMDADHIWHAGQHSLGIDRVRETPGGDRLSPEMLRLLTRVAEGYELFPSASSAHPQSSLPRTLSSIVSGSSSQM